MRPDDETPQVPDADEPDSAGDAGEHPVPPATWAGRQRAAGKDAEPDEEVHPGLTEEFEKIERDLDQELAGLAGLSVEEGERRA